MRTVKGVNERRRGTLAPVLLRPFMTKLYWAAMAARNSGCRVIGAALAASIPLGKPRAAHPSTPHLYLSVLGVDPPRQGQGVGSRLIAPGLELCDREGVPAYLETARERNVVFYERHGFRVMRDLRLPRGPTVWLMWRDPR